MKTVVLQDVSKTYPGGKEAVKGISLSLNEGEVFGFLGPNGSGKTTTIKMLNGVLTPSAGQCRVMGLDSVKCPEKVHAISGVLTEHAQMYDGMTGFQNLIFYAGIFGVLEQEAKNRARFLLEKLELEEAADQKLTAYSTGMRQKLSLARAMIHHPKVLFLDEPTSGLDPESAQNVNKLIKEIAGKQGVTVFLCTHQLRYAQEICTRYGLISKGELLAAGTLDELRKRVDTGTELRIRTEKWLCTKINSEKEIPAIIRNMVNEGKDIYEVEIRYPTLEDIYFELTSGGKENKNESRNAYHYEKRFLRNNFK